MTKKCNRCEIGKETTEYFSNAWSPDGLKSICKVCSKATCRRYMHENRARYNAIHRSVRQKRAAYYRAIDREKSAKWRLTHPWYQSYSMAKDRCTNIKRASFKHYGAKGIKFILTVSEVKKLWERDQAHLLRRPSIDRINPRENYEFANCRFIELSENSRRAALRPKQEIPT